MNQFLDGVVLDLETTGMSCYRDRIIEIGAIKIRNGMETDVFEQLVNPRMPISIEARAVNHIDDADLIDKPFIEDVLPNLLEFIGNDTIMGFRIQFDLNMLEAEASRCRLPFIPAGQIDVKVLSQMRYPASEYHALEDVLRRLGISDREKHRALSDARQTLLCYNRLAEMDGPQELPPDDSDSSKRRMQTKTRNVMRARFMAGNDTNLRNIQPEGPVIDDVKSVGLTGEQSAQDLLRSYGDGAWVWVTARRGINPGHGCHSGEPTILVELDHHLIGWMTSQTAKKRYGQIPNPYGVAKAHIKYDQEKGKYHLRLELPELTSSHTDPDEWNEAMKHLQLTTNIAGRC